MSKRCKNKVKLLFCLCLCLPMEKKWTNTCFMVKLETLSTRRNAVGNDTYAVPDTANADFPHTMLMVCRTQTGLDSSPLWARRTTNVQNVSRVCENRERYGSACWVTWCIAKEGGGGKEGRLLLKPATSDLSQSVPVLVVQKFQNINKPCVWERVGVWGKGTRGENRDLGWGPVNTHAEDETGLILRWPDLSRFIYKTWSAGFKNHCMVTLLICLNLMRLNVEATANNS